MCQIECQVECQKECQIECQTRCQIECQNIRQINCQKECQNVEYIYIYISDRMSFGGDHMKKVILKVIITHAVPLHECGELMFFRNIKPMFVGYSESEQPGGHSNFPFLAMTAAQDNCSPRQ